MFINCSNHPSNSWSIEQKVAAECWGEISDVPFPNVPSDADRNRVVAMADSLADEMVEMKPDAVMCQGEFTLTFALVSKLKELGITVVSACSERDVYEERKPDGTVQKISRFKFIKFRDY